MRYAEDNSQKLEKISTAISVIVKVLLGLEVFIVPLFFLPFTVEYYETSKVFIITFLNIIILALLLIQSMFRNEFFVFRTHLESLFLLFSTSILVSTLFSNFKTVSLLGYFGRGYDTFFFFISLIVFVYLLLQVLKHEVQVERMVNTFILSCCVLCIMFFLNKYNLIPSYGKIYGLLKSADFSPFISIDALSYFLLIPIVFTLSFVYNLLTERLYSAANIIKIGVYGLALVLMYSVVALGTNSYLPYVILAIASLYHLYLLYRINTKGKAFFFIAGIILFLFIGAFALKLFVGNPYNIQTLSFGYGWEIAKGTIGSFKNFVFGSGPDTFYFQFLKYVPSNYYTTNQYLTQFSKAPTEILQIIITTGFFGLISYLALIFIPLINSLKLFKSVGDHVSKSIIAGLSTIILVSFLISIFTYGTVVSYFVFFFVLGLLIFESNINNFEHKNHLNIKITVDNYWDKTSNIFKNTFYAVLILLLVIVGYLDVTNYESQVIYFQSINTRNLQQAYNDAVSASEKEGFVDYYQNQVSLAGVEIVNAISSTYSQTKDSTTQKNLSSLADNLLKQSIQKSQYTIIQNNLNPTDINANISLLDLIYRNIQKNSSYLQNAINNNEYLVSLYPNNVSFLDKLGSLYYENNDTDKAVAVLQQVYLTQPKDANFAYDYILALEQKKDYTTAIPILKDIIGNVNKTSTLYKSLNDELSKDESSLLAGIKK